ncbi:MAG: glycosyltransferase family 39 protein [Planctomycetota bacterium]
MSPTNTSRHFDRWTIGTLVCVTLWMVWAAGHYTVFDDEAFSCQRYVLPMGEMISALWDGVEPDPPLYYVLQNLSVRVAGVGPLGLRALSIVMFLAGLVAMRATGQAWFDRRTGLVTMLLCALHPAHLFFGFAARWYSTMFLMVALLLWVTRLLADVQPTTPALHRRERRLILLWALASAAVCYTNYFGPVVVGLVWLVSIARHSCKKRWLGAGLIAAALFTPWLPPFWRQATAFPQFGGSPSSMLATAARTTMALLAGDLASPRAWWVWGPMLVLCVLLLVRAWQERSRVWPIGAIVVGCFLAGTLSRTMIDKYVMTFSGIACMGVAALLTASCRAGHAPMRLAACTTLTLAWSACGFNLVRETNWSSLRWLDPFPTAVSDTMDTGVPLRQWAVTHPSGRYYAAMENVKRHNLWSSHDAFSSLALVPPLHRCKCDDYVRTPGLLPSVIAKKTPTSLVTLEASGFADSTDWEELRSWLQKDYQVTDEKRYQLDPDADWKDRIDPKYGHPRWRITVRLWERRLAVTQPSDDQR